MTPKVETPLGRLRGLEGAVQRFLGVPFAEPPVGPHRWRPPRPKQPWAGVLACDRFGTDPVQPSSPALRGAGIGEDCLHLNIWVPKERDGPLPVLVWIPGGGFTAGSGSNAVSDGAALAAKGAVVVSVNYRVGVLGFLAHPSLSQETDDGVSGNYGLMDIIEALRWIRANIACFGGDPERVTLSGVSAGAACISLLLTTSASRGLFQRVILQSPGAGRRLATLEEAMDAGGQVLPGKADDLRLLPAAELLSLNARFNAGLRSLTRPRILRPILDGRLLQVQERQALESGAFTAMPMIVGNHLDEGRFFAKTFPPHDAASYRAWLLQDFGDRAAELLDLYGKPSDAAVSRHLAALFGDTQFNFGARLLARCNQDRAATWRYLFDGVDSHGHVTTHTEELPYCFGTGGDDASLAAGMMQAWVRFAVTGKVPDWAPSCGDQAWLPAARRAQDGWRARQLDFAASL